MTIYYNDEISRKHLASEKLLLFLDKKLKLDESFLIILVILRTHIQLYESLLAFVALRLWGQ